MDVGNPGGAWRLTARRSGFALVGVVAVLTLLALVGVGFLALSAIEVRKGSRKGERALAKANARLAMVEAIGQLQRHLGPDQRVSAAAAILSDPAEPHWTGAWRTDNEDGGSFWVRDPETGSLQDLRMAEEWEAGEEVLAWLVSGGAEPTSALPAGESVELVGAGSVAAEDGRVRAPVVEITGSDGGRQRLAWWVGDLGVRANVSVPDAYAGREIDPSRPENGGYNRVLTSQQADAAVMEGGVSFENEERPKLASEGMAEVGAEERPAWAARHYHDFTVHSSGVLADVREGGLKADLTAYFAGRRGRVPPLGPLPGLNDDAPIIGAPAWAPRFRLASPRFGVLHDWARRVVSFSGRDVESVPPEIDAGAGGGSEDLALVNESPARLKGATQTSLQPILVEGSFFLKITTFRIADPPEQLFQLRHNLYPRVVLWNPYNVELTLDPAIVMIQGNGRQEFWTYNRRFDSKGNFVGFSESQWLSFEGGRSTRADFVGKNGIKSSIGYHDPYIGSYYFAIPRTVFEPGECLVFSAARAAEYDGQSPYRPGPYNLANNLLSCEVGPDPAVCYYVSGSDIGGGISFRPTRYWYEPTPAWSSDGRGVVNQVDDSRVVMKAIGNESVVTYESFDELAQLAYISASLQYGAGREPRIAWDDRSKVEVELLDRDNPRAQIPPDVRTREGIRLRWFEEHVSNFLNSGALAGSPRYLEEAPFANWNLRAAYAMRSPWENLGGTMASDFSGGGPWFFGIYTRDLYDESVGWAGQAPLFFDGRYHGNPFGPPQEGRERYILFELPRAETGLVSLGQLQHAKVSEFVWHPSFPIGNSLADPRLGEDGLDGTVPRGENRAEDALGGFERRVIGWSDDGERSDGPDEWAAVGRAILHSVPHEDNVVYDLSYELNHALWDRYYLSGGDKRAMARFLADAARNPLPSGRMRLSRATAGEATSDRLSNFHRAAYHLEVEGAFNVNSTRVEAWKAVLAATRGTGFGGEEGAAAGSPFPRMLDPAAGAWRAGDAPEDDAAWAGFRALSDDEIGRLAEAIVEEVKARGPFLSLADFVNRRLTNDETGKRGVLQAAIDRAGLNAAFEEAYALSNDESLPDYQHPDNIRDATRLEQTLKPETKAWGAPGFLTQGDLLQVLGPMLTARSDTFVVRAYGSATSADGRTTAEAWCEAVVQRTPKPLEADETGLNSERAGEEGDFGRQFVIKGFRWLAPDEV